jgi:single-strand DNA-binding protein
MFNKVIMVGNLTRDPELRYTPQGTAVATLRLAINSRFRSGEEFKEETLFIDTVVWGKQAETSSQYLSKGRQVLVEGRLQERQWESDGQKKSKMEIVANTVRFLGGGGGQGGGQGRSEGGHQAGGGRPPEEISDIEPF